MIQRMRFASIALGLVFAGAAFAVPAPTTSAQSSQAQASVVQAQAAVPVNCVLHPNLCGAGA